MFSHGHLRAYSSAPDPIPGAAEPVLLIENKKSERRSLSQKCKTNGLEEEEASGPTLLSLVVNSKHCALLSHLSRGQGCGEVLRSGQELGVAEGGWRHQQLHLCS